MKKIIIFLIVFFLLFFTTDATAHPSQPVNVKEIVKKISPSIVKVISENHLKYVATGIAIDQDYIITSGLISKYPYTRIYIKTVKGDRYNAKITGKDKHSSITLLRINKKALIPIQQSRDFEVGEWVALVGVFYKNFPSIFQGILSSISDDAMILNAPVVPGSSGGAVVNKNAELIGVIRGRFGFSLYPDYTYKDYSSEVHILSSKSKNETLCIATPINRVYRIVEELKKYGKVRRGWLGVTLISRGKTIRLAKVVKNSPAEKAGLKKGDIILEISGKPIHTHSDLTKTMRLFRPKQRVKVKIRRNNIEKTVVALLGESQGKTTEWSFDFFSSPLISVPEMQESLPLPMNYRFYISGSRSLGVDIITLTPELADKFNISEGSGLMISKVYKNTAADKAGLREADIIVSANKKKIKKSADLRRALNDLKDNEVLVITIYRNGKSKKIKTVPEKMTGVTGLMDRMKKKMREINIKISEEQKKWSEEELLKKYEMEIEKMREEQKRLKDEIKKLKEMMKKRKGKEEQVI